MLVQQSNANSHWIQDLSRCIAPSFTPLNHVCQQLHCTNGCIKLFCTCRLPRHLCKHNEMERSEARNPTGKNKPKSIQIKLKHLACMADFLLSINGIKACFTQQCLNKSVYVLPNNILCI